jgi:hypothetical protein
MMQLIRWLAEQPPSVATFLGTLTGSLFGLLAILAGALVNAQLNRRRDDRLRMEEARSICGALAGELTGIRDAFNNMAKKSEENADKASAEWDSFLIPDITLGVRVMPQLLSKFGLLSAHTVRQVIEAYVHIEQFRATLLMAGGTLHPNDHPYRGHLQMPRKRAGFIATVAKNTAKTVEAAIATLNDSQH